MKRLIPILMVLLLIAAGCGEKDPGPRGVGVNAGASDAQVRQDYEDSMERMREQVESPSAPPLDQSISAANRNQLLDAAKRWDQAVAIAKSVTPPKDAAAAHKDLVVAMEGLGDWNRRIAQAAPNKPATKKLARQARKSAESKQFQAAVSSLESAGYVTFVSAPEDPLAGASDPASG